MLFSWPNSSLRPSSPMPIASSSLTSHSTCVYALYAKKSGGFSLVVNLGTELEKGRAKMIQCFTLCSAILTDPNNVTQKRSRVMAAMDWLEFHPKNGYFARPVELYTTCVVRGSLADFIHPQWILCRCAYTDKKDRFTVDKI